MIKGLAGLPQNGGKKIENFWAWKSAEEKQKVFKITNKVQQSGIEEQYWFVSHKIGTAGHAAMSLIISNKPHTTLFLCYVIKLKPTAKRYSVSDSKVNR